MLSVLVHYEFKTQIKLIRGNVRNLLHYSRKGKTQISWAPQRDNIENLFFGSFSSITSSERQRPKLMEPRCRVGFEILIVEAHLANIT